MRARTAALVPALLTLALLGAGCGGGDDSAATPTPAAATSTPVPGAPSEGANGSGAATTTPSGSDGGGTGVSTRDSLSEQISRNPDLRTFSTALNTAGLTSLLDSGTYTVFAPNNDAFTKLGTQLDTLLQPGGKAQLVNILKFHIVKGKFKAKKLKDGKLLTTLQGTRVRVTVKNGDVLLGNNLAKATVLTPDAKAANGITHTVDTVMKPKTGA
jgi:uncharacterized surface protein with fasciclin (FAS1) repeats